MPAAFRIELAIAVDMAGIGESLSGSWDCSWKPLGLQLVTKEKLSGLSVCLITIDFSAT